MRYYREPNGDFLAIDLSSLRYYQTHFKKDQYEGRATAIAGLASSICTTSVGAKFLATCTKVKKADVPREWQKWIG